MAKRCRICPVVVCYCVDLSLNILAPWPATKSQGVHNPKRGLKPKDQSAHWCLRGHTMCGTCREQLWRCPVCRANLFSLPPIRCIRCKSLNLFLLRNILCCLLCILWLSPPGIWRWRTSPACSDPSLTAPSVLTIAILLEFEPPSFRNGSLYAYLICISKWNYE